MVMVGENLLLSKGCPGPPELRARCVPVSGLAEPGPPWSHVGAPLAPGALGVIRGDQTEKAPREGSDGAGASGRWSRTLWACRAAEAAAASVEEAAGQCSPGMSLAHLPCRRLAGAWLAQARRWPSRESSSASVSRTVRSAAERVGQALNVIMHLHREDRQFQYIAIELCAATLQEVSARASPRHRRA